LRGIPFIGLHFEKINQKVKDLNGDPVEQWFSFSGVVLSFPSREVAYIEGEAAGLLMNKGIT
jgi:hypothetical protein